MRRTNSEAFIAIPALHWRDESRVKVPGAVVRKGQLVFSICRRKEEEMGERFPTVRHERLLGFIDSSHLIDQSKAEEGGWGGMFLTGTEGPPFSRHWQMKIRITGGKVVYRQQKQ